MLLKLFTVKYNICAINAYNINIHPNKLLYWEHSCNYYSDQEIENCQHPRNPLLPLPYNNHLSPTKSKYYLELYGNCFLVFLYSFTTKMCH